MYRAAFAHHFSEVSIEVDKFLAWLKATFTRNLLIHRLILYKLQYASAMSSIYKIPKRLYHITEFSFEDPKPRFSSNLEAPWCPNYQHRLHFSSPTHPVSQR